MIRLCQRSRLFERICNALHVKQISHDYFLLWHEAENDVERENIYREYKREMALALLVPFGIHTSEVIALHYFSLQSLYVLFFVIVAAMLHVIGGRLK